MHLANLSRHHNTSTNVLYSIQSEEAETEKHLKCGLLPILNPSSCTIEGLSHVWKIMYMSHLRLPFPIDHI